MELEVLLLLFLSCDAFAAIRNGENYIVNHVENEIVNMDVINRIAQMETPDFIKYYGYPCESHEVITKDGYVLTMHHIPHGTNGSVDDIQPVVFLMHGLFSFSGHWLTNGPKKSLGFILADEGYDVWVGNVRGSKYSRNHVDMNPDTNATFWDFSFHEMGCYDLPAMIDYILNYTQQEKVFYVGHSQGTTTYFVMLSERPEYNEKIIAQYSLAPEVFLNHMYGPGLKLATVLENFFNLAEDLFNIHEISYESRIFKFLAHKFCSVAKELCVNELFHVMGYDSQQFNYTLLPIIAANIPAGSSVKQLKHFAQEIRSGNFQRYDYEFLKNEEIYGQFSPPKYNLKNVKAPVYLFYSLNDYLSSPIDVKRLFRELPDGQKRMWKVENKKWNHIDYLWGIDARRYVYDRILRSMKLDFN